MNKFDAIYEEQLLELPELERNAIQSIDWQTLIFSIGKKYGLHLDELDELRTETMLVLVGLTEHGDYYNHLLGELALSPSVGEKIVADVNAQILEPVKAYVMRGGPIGARAETWQDKAAEKLQSSSPQDLGGTLKSVGIELIEPKDESAPISSAHVSTGTLAHAGIMPAPEIPSHPISSLSQEIEARLKDAEQEEIPPPPATTAHEHHDTPLASKLTELLAGKNLAGPKVSAPEKHDVLI
jgi:hypothetical protein